MSTDDSTRSAEHAQVASLNRYAISDHEMQTWRNQAESFAMAYGGNCDDHDYDRILRLLDAVGRVKSLVPFACWVTRSTEVFCWQMIGGTFPNGTEFTFDTCCLPCQLRLTLEVVTPPGCGICGKPLTEVGTSRCYEAHGISNPPESLNGGESS